MVLVLVRSAMQLLDDVAHFTTHAWINVLLLFLAGDRPAMDPGITGSSASTLEVKKLAVAKIGRAGHLCRVSRPLGVNPLLDAVHNVAGLVKDSAVGASSCLSRFDICIP